MSARPIEIKQRRKVIKALRRTPPAYFDLVAYLLDRRLAPSKRVAKEMILAGRVKADSHPLGILKGQEVATPGILGSVKMEVKDVVNPRIPIDLKSRISVAAA